jgi:ferrous iron transport protein B
MTESPAAPPKPVTVALAGNPNAGKTTIVNGLTGTRHTVGNYPGVTVEKKEGYFAHEGREVTIVDLPGTYSLTAVSLDELVARNFVIEEDPDLVVSVVDASNLERSLYLTIQFMELGVPLIVVLNKSDVAESRGLSVDTRKLSQLLNAPIVKTVAHEGKGLDELRDAIISVVTGDGHTPTIVTYGREVESEIRRLKPALEGLDVYPRREDRWLAVKLLEGDSAVRERLEKCGKDTGGLLAKADEAAARITRHFGDPAEIVIADQRYGFISGACTEAVRTTVEIRHTLSDRLDEVLTNRALGIPIFLLMMYLMFKLTFTLGAPAMEWIEALFEWIAALVGGFWPEGSQSAFKSLLVDGVIGGVGGVLVFLPNIALLFAAIAILEDSGYMARGAFIMDRFMHKIGLHGRSFIPAMIGFGCTVPAIMATRTLQSRRDRMATMLVLPLISCGARFPIYTLFTAAFFPVSWRARILFVLYLTGIALAALFAKLLRATVFSGETSPFVMELPPYRVPTARAILFHTWERARLFLRKAGTLIVVASVILWVLTNFPKPAESDLAGLSPEEQRGLALSGSVAGRIGHALEPAMQHVGFDWKTTTALIGAFAAKEIFVAQLGIVYSLGDAAQDSLPLRDKLQQEYTRLQAFCIMLFCLISVPCVATIGVTRAESGKWRWAVLQLCGLTLLAYAVTFVVYQGGTLLGSGVAG